MAKKNRAIPTDQVAKEIIAFTRGWVAKNCPEKSEKDKEKTVAAFLETLAGG